MNKILLENQVAIITGGSSGMGRGIAYKFAEEGCSSVIVDVNEAGGKETVDEVIKRGKEAIFIKCDVSNSAQVKSMVEQAINKFKKIDILVNCAGMGTPGRPLLETTEEEWDRVVAINMKGMFLTCQAIAPHFMENKSGNIINIVSLAALGGTPVSIHYAASKAAALSISRSIAAALVSYNVRVNTINPGMIRTGMSAVFAGDVEDVDAFYDMMAQGQAMGRIGTPEDIANAALFFASELSSYTTQDAIAVGGGPGRMRARPS